MKGDEWLLLVTVTYDFEKFMVKNSKIIEVARCGEPNTFLSTGNKGVHFK